MDCKACRLCGETKPVELFEKTKFGHRSECKKCKYQQAVARLARKLDENPNHLLPKTCTKCEVEKPADDFYKVRARGSVRHGRCKVCSAEIHRAYRAANAESIRAQRESMKEHNDAVSNIWKDNNRRSLRAASRRYRERHPERVLEASRRSNAKARLKYPGSKRKSVRASALGLAKEYVSIARPVRVLRKGNPEHRPRVSSGSWRKSRVG
jgi:hypothetical protein